VRFEWDEAKRKTNIVKPGIDFEDVPEMFAKITASLERSASDSFAGGS